MSLKTLINWTLVGGLILLNQPALADSPKLQVSPNKCVALNQGNICYLDLDIHWQSPEDGHYCLYLSNRKQPLECWQNSKQGSYSFEFAEAQTATLRLQEQTSKQLLGEAVIEVKWVYSSRRNASVWRVF